MAAHQRGSSSKLLLHSHSSRRILLRIPRYFRDQPLASSEITDEYLVLWYFEDWLKKYFFAVLQILEVCF